MTASKFEDEVQTACRGTYSLNLPVVTYDLKQAFKQGKGGRDVRDGWDVFVNEEWHERFSTKAKAKAEIAVIQARDAKTRAILTAAD